MTDSHHASKKQKDHETDSLAARVLERITDEQVTPRPRWTYLLKNRALWVVAILALVVAAGAAAAVFFVLANAGWQYASATHGSPFALLIAALPIVWLVLLIAFLVAGYWNIRHTARGYRYPLPVVVAMITLVTILSGVALFSMGLGQEVEEGIGRHIPFYRPFLQQERSWWNRADDGLLVGTVASITPDFSSFVLKTGSGELLQIDGTDLRAPDIAVLVRGGTVRIVGVPRAATSTQPFHACFVFPWSIEGGPAQPPQLPLAVLTGSTSERIPTGERSDKCKGVVPYHALRALEGDGRN